MCKKSLIVQVLFLTSILFLNGCIKVKNYEFNNITNIPSAKLAITTDTIIEPRLYLLANYSLQFRIFRLSEAKQEKSLYMGRIILTTSTPHKIISIPSGEPIIISAYYIKNILGSTSTCKPSVKLIAKPNGYYELLFHDEDNVCTLQIISDKEDNLKEHLENNKL